MASLYYSRPEIKIRASGVNIRINNDEFIIQDLDKIDSIMITAKSGYISIYALRLFALKNITLSLHNLNGELIYHVIPQYPNKNLDNRILQYQQYLQNRKKVGDMIVKAKKQKYEKLLEKLGLPSLTSNEESVYSNEYWAYIGRLFNEYGYNYYSRKGFYAVNNQKAIHPINSILNFYYGLIEHRLLNDFSYYGLDYNISFLHIPQYNKLPLTYDIIEFLRADIDYIVLQLAKEKAIKTSDFELTNKGYYLLKEEKIKKYLQEIEPIENKTKQTVENFIELLAKI
jgi:CRISPR/Cas system-associated endonuclease Cas1